MQEAYPTGVTRWAARPTTYCGIVPDDVHRAAYLEVKPRSFSDFDSLKERMEIIWSSEPAAALGVIVVDVDQVPGLVWASEGQGSGWSWMGDWLDEL